jgi:hypothetical protein
MNTGTKCLFLVGGMFISLVGIFRKCRDMRLCRFYSFQIIVNVVRTLLHRLWEYFIVWSCQRLTGCLKQSDSLVVPGWNTSYSMSFYELNDMFRPHRGHRQVYMYDSCSFVVVVVFFLSFSGWGETESTWYVGHCWTIVPAPDDDYGAVGGMRIGRGNQSTRRKPAPVPLCPPQIPHGLTWDRTRAAAVGSQRLTAWAMARPHDPCRRAQLHGVS